MNRSEIMMSIEAMTREARRCDADGQQEEARRIREQVRDMRDRIDRETETNRCAWCCGSCNFH